ncbi:MAG: carboxypeptidase M32 [Rhodospirillales bacterium]|nr:carboxypeptidase M32 [Rhodospirillales bacterium]MCW8952578.1 carboxypeptidase M32 [Rhodospirillales bacterium]MCW9002384.1 carboxypeptidase M32 [Rhodospirillales bacterium]MCW9039589.1 carboxypeptidase M32 [Rhodospirillales bacterium]
MKQGAYHRLEDRFRRANAVNDARGMLHWDMAAMMPPGGAEGRAEQLAVLAGLSHGLMAEPETAVLLDAAKDETLDAWQSANLREMHRRWVHETALPADLVEALSRASSACEQVWRKARADADFAAVLPTLKTLLGLVREAAAAKGAALGCGLYDALLDEYEPGGRSVEIDAQFAELEEFLPGLIKAVLERQSKSPAPVMPDGPFSVERQKALGLRMMQALGFDFTHGRLDISLHPFCGGTPDDVRITTRYDENDFTSGMMGVLHETGHALYERGLPVKWRGQPVGAARGMSMHESQSLLVEMQACRSSEFLGFAAPLIAETFGGKGTAWEADNLLRLYGQVERSFIRVDADEVTYPAHVILRYRIERALIEGDMKPEDIPGAWNEGMSRLLGVVPPNDRQGCLQDIHWYDGAWGYFPTYTLGAMTAAQLFDAAIKAVPAIPEAIGRGDFAPLMGWLGENVHALGSFLPTRDLLIRATGRPLDVSIFRRHLERRYLGKT